MSCYQTVRIATALAAVSVLGACASGEKLIAYSAATTALRLRPAGTDSSSAIHINIGETLPLEAVPLTADSTVAGDPVAARWTSSDTLKLVVSAQGELQARCVGPASVDAVAIVAGRTLSG